MERCGGPNCMRGVSGPNACMRDEHMRDEHALVGLAHPPLRASPPMRLSTRPPPLPTISRLLPRRPHQSARKQVESSALRAQQPSLTQYSPPQPPPQPLSYPPLRQPQPPPIPHARPVAFRTHGASPPTLPPVAPKIGYNEIRYDTIRYNAVRYDMMRYDTIRYDMI